MEALVVGSRVVACPQLCRNCQACTLGCSLFHEGKCGLVSARLTVDKDLETGHIEIAVCRQCADAACVEACPTGAMRYRDERVHLEEADCTQCGACMDACPYEGIKLVSGRYLKCDLCDGRAEGPLCVELCPVAALAVETAWIEEGIR